MAVNAMRDGAYDFIEKPFSSDVLVDAVRRGLDKRNLVLENRHLREALTQGTRLENRLVGQSLGAIKLREKITQFAAVDVDVLITGETGAGKEQVAQALHELSRRREDRFVPVNCGALPETTIESELFGYEKGAFTGADHIRIGKFEYADGGTVFLDEIESMPLDIKACRSIYKSVCCEFWKNAKLFISARTPKFPLTSALLPPVREIFGMPCMPEISATISITGSTF